MRTSQQIEAEIEEKFSFFPPFFSPALQTPQLLENLWQQTCYAYIDNPLPALFKEKLSAYLSRFCPVPYCLVCHSCSLRQLGMQASEILNLLVSAPPSRQDVDEHLQLLATHYDLLKVLSELDSLLEDSLLNCAIFIALNTVETERCRQELRCLLGVENYQYLITFIAYIKTCHEWMESHPKIRYEADKRVQDNLNALIAEEPELAKFFNTYWERTKHEQPGWLSRLSVEELQSDKFTKSLFERAFNSASDGLLLSDPNQPDNPIIYANPAFSKLTGYQPKEVIGRNCRFLQGPETNQQVVTQLRQAIAQQQEIQVTLLNYRKDGQPFWNELKIAPVHADTGEILYFVGIQTDVTKREQAEAQMQVQEILLEQAEDRMQAQARLLDQSKDAIVVLNLENRILFWNNSATHLFGWTAQEAIGCYIDELLFEESSRQLRQAQTSIIEQGEWQGELQHRRKDGGQVIVDSRWTLIQDQLEQPQSVLVSSTNITERKQAEFYQQRIQRFESISTVACGLAHDINNALAPVLMSIELLATRLPDEQSQKLLATLQKNTVRTADAVKQVLSFVRGLEGEKNTLCVKSFLLGIESLIQHRWPRNILIRTNIASNLWSVFGNKDQLHRVLMNLCENALEVMPEGGIFRLSANNIWIDENFGRANADAQVGPHVLITVSDTGIGIPTENLNRIFEPFFTTKEFGKGTGLGLSMVVAIVKGHGGFVEVESIVGQGTDLKVYLPAQLSPSLYENLILLIEHDDISRRVIQRGLEQAHYRVLATQDGIEAIALCAEYQSQFKTVVINLSISEPDASTTIRALRRINPQAVIVAVNESMRVDQLDDDAKRAIDFCLNRSDTTEALAARLKAILLTFTERQ